MTCPIYTRAMGSKQVYTVKEVCRLMGFSHPTVTKLFENERGVIVLQRPEKMHKRPYRSLRIPHPVYERVLRSMTR
jgi:hypothetical protein